MANIFLLVKALLLCPHTRCLCFSAGRQLSFLSMTLTLSVCILLDSHSIVSVFKNISFLSPSVSMRNFFTQVLAKFTIMHQITYKTLAVQRKLFRNVNEIINFKHSVILYAAGKCHTRPSQIKQKSCKLNFYFKRFLQVQ